MINPQGRKTNNHTSAGVLSGLTPQARYAPETSARTGQSSCGTSTNRSWPHSLHCSPRCGPTSGDVLCNIMDYLIEPEGMQLTALLPARDLLRLLRNDDVTCFTVRCYRDRPGSHRRRLFEGWRKLREIKRRNRPETSRLIVLFGHSPIHFASFQRLAAVGSGPPGRF